MSPADATHSDATVEPALSQWANDLARGDRGALARAITLVESSLDTDRIRASRLLDLVWTRRPADTLRFAVTGPPGAGKSTLIEQIGAHLLANGRRVAVLTVDPTSRRSGGSILGDKTRMPGLASHADAFVRPSPSAGNLGGVTRSTRDVIVLCEAAGFDATIVETVGVGQSEIDVEGIVDFVVLVLLAGAGDELQGIKRGILEVADIVTVNKLDADREAVLAARRLYKTALSILEPRFQDWKPPVYASSAVTGEGVDQIVDALLRVDATTTESGVKEEQRASQRGDWFRTALRELLVTRMLANQASTGRMDALLEDATTGKRNPAVLAHEFASELSGTPTA